MWNRFTLMRQSSSGEDLWSISARQHMGLTCRVIKCPWCAPFVSQGEKATHACIIGGELFWDDFFFSLLTVQFICLLVGNRCESFTVAAPLQHPHSPFFCSDLLSTFMTEYQSIITFSCISYLVSCFLSFLCFFFCRMLVEKQSHVLARSKIWLFKLLMQSLKFSAVTVFVHITRLLQQGKKT